LKLIVHTTDLRGRYPSKTRFRSKVIDQDTGEQIGFVEETRSPPRRHISLFGGKYHGDFTKPEECAAFAKGVEAVLNHMVEQSRLDAAVVAWRSLTAAPSCGIDAPQSPRAADAYAEPVHAVEKASRARSGGR
jgi:hypothetical protein